MPWNMVAKTWSSTGAIRKNLKNYLKDGKSTVHLVSSLAYAVEDGNQFYNGLYNGKHAYSKWFGKS